MGYSTYLPSFSPPSYEIRILFDDHVLASFPLALVVNIARQLDLGIVKPDIHGPFGCPEFYNEALSGLSLLPWSQVAEYLDVAPDTATAIEQLWNSGQNTADRYHMECRRRTVPHSVFRYTCDKRGDSEQRERLRQLLGQGLLYFSSPEQFNDPFDCACDYVTLEAFRGRGMVCFSECGDNPLMFSHYADCHTGFSIQFQLDSLCRSMTRFAPSVRPVHYFQKAPPFFVQTEKPLAGTFKNAIWRHEQEHRLFLEAGDNDVLPPGLYPFDRNCIQAIGFGCNATDDTMAFVQALSADIPNISYWRALRRERDYRLQFEQLWTPAVVSPQNKRGYSLPYLRAPVGGQIN